MHAAQISTEAGTVWRGRWRPVLVLAFLTLIWGLSIPIMKLGLDDLSPLALVSLRYLGAAPFFALFLIRRRAPPRRTLIALAGLGALGIGAGQVLQILGVQRTSAAVATIIGATIPIFTVLLAVLRLRQAVRLHHVLGLGVALTGIALATTGTDRGVGDFSAGAAVGDACLLMSALCIAAYYVLSTEMAVRHGVVTVSAWTTIFGALLLAPLAVWRIGAGDVRWTPLGIGVVAYLGLLVTVLGTWIWLHALRALPARVAASSQYVQPLIGVAASAAIFQTSLDAGFAAGSVLVLTGIALCSIAGGARA